MEKKTKLYLIAAFILLAGIGGAVVGFKVTGIRRPGTPPGCGLDDREIEKLERGLEEGSQRSAEGIEGAIGAAGSFEERIGRIGENADRTGDGIEELGGIVEELRKRGGKEDP